MLATGAVGQTASPHIAKARVAVPGRLEFNVRGFGAAGDGRSDDTSALTRAIAAASSAGGTVVVPPGRYRIGTVHLQSGIVIDLRSGASLLGSPAVTDYATIASAGLDRNYGTNSSGEGDRIGMLYAENVHDITITGQGSIDGSGDSFFDPQTLHDGHDYDAATTRNPDAFARDMLTSPEGPLEQRASGRPGTMIIFNHARNIHIDGIALRNAPNWTLHLQHARDIFVRGIRVENNPKLPNNDGMDCMDCHGVHVSDSELSAGDDDFAFVGSDDVTVANCTLHSFSAAIRVEDTHNAIFSNLVIHANRGIGIFARAGTETHHVVFTHLLLETHLRHGHWWGKGEPVYIAVAAAAGHGGVHDIEFSDMVVDSEAGMLLDARDPGTVHDIVLRNIRLTLHGPPPDLAAAVGGNFDMRWTATSLREAIYRHDTPALYARNIDALTLDGFRVAWPAEHAPAYFSHALQISNFHGLTIRGFEGSAARAGDGLAAMELSQGSGLTLRDSTALPGTSRFVRLTDVAGPVFTTGNNLAGAAVKGLP